MMICHLTDLHIRAPGSLAYGRIDTHEFFTSAIDALVKLSPAPDAFLLTGDLTDYGRPEEYAALAQGLASLGRPAYLLPGNHDDREAMRMAFPNHTYLHNQAEFLQYRIELASFAVVALDTVVPGKPHGILDADRLSWLHDHLDHVTPTIIAMHHPPFVTGIEGMDQAGLLEGATELETLLSAHHNIERIVCGHLHRSIQARFANTFASTCPSPAHQIALNLEPGAASAWNFEPPGYQLHAWRGGRLVTHTGVLGHFEGPYPFRNPGSTLLNESPE
jgi:3',5'-cyclic AMP phosphodiesterase CpdA